MLKINAHAALILTAATLAAMPLAAIAQTSPSSEASDVQEERSGLHRAIQWAQTELTESGSTTSCRRSPAIRRNEIVAVLDFGQP